MHWKFGRKLDLSLIYLAVLYIHWSIRNKNLINLCRKIVNLASKYTFWGENRLKHTHSIVYARVRASFLYITWDVWLWVAEIFPGLAWLTRPKKSPVFPPLAWNKDAITRNWNKTSGKWWGKHEKKYIYTRQNKYRNETVKKLQNYKNIP